MSVSNLKQLITQELHNLSQSDLQELKLKVDFLLSSHESSQLDWLTEGFVFELKRRGLLSGIVSKARIDREAPSSYFTRCKAIRELLLSKGKNINAREYVPLGRVAAAALADYLTYHGEVRLKQMLNNIDNVPIAFERAFPDYLESGMIEIVLRKVGETIIKL